MAAPTSAPGVEAGLYGLVLALGKDLESRPSVLSRTYRDVLLSVRPARLAMNLKFEWAMTHVEAHAKVATALINAWFGDLEPNANHLAIGSLRRSAWARWVATTNFDAGLERTGAFAVVAGPWTGSTGDVTKLHGDPHHPESLVATLETLARRKASYGVQVLLDLSKRIDGLLVVGYSGMGDVDIFPVLRSLANSGLPIWWCVRENAIRPRDISLAGIVEIDLDTEEKNVLRLLAGVGGAMTSPVRGNELIERARMAAVPIVEPLDPKTRLWLSVSLLMEAGLSTEAARVLWGAEQANWSVPPLIEARSRERMSAYSLALVPARRITSEAQSDSQEASARAREAFFAQESGRVGRSLQLFADAVRQRGEGSDALDEGITRGWVEAEIERTFRMWRSQERTKALQALARSVDFAWWIGQLEESAPMSAQLWRFAQLRVEYLLAEDAAVRRRTTTLLIELLADMHALQYAEAESGLLRFLSRVGIESPRGDSRNTGMYGSGRDRFKGVIARVQGRLRFLPAPLTMEVPPLAKAAFDAIACVRWRLLRASWWFSRTLEGPWRRKEPRAEGELGTVQE